MSTADAASTQHSPVEVAMAAAEQLVAAQAAAVAGAAPHEVLPAGVIALLLAQPAPVPLGDTPGPELLARASRLVLALEELEAAVERRLGALGDRIEASRRQPAPAAPPVRLDAHV